MANDSSQVSVLDLENGLRVIAIEFPGSTYVSIFSFLPLGLMSDGPGQAQWSHLVEHLVAHGTRVRALLRGGSSEHWLPANSLVDGVVSLYLLVLSTGRDALVPRLQDVHYCRVAMDARNDVLSWGSRCSRPRVCGRVQTHHGRL